MRKEDIPVESAPDFTGMSEGSRQDSATCFTAVPEVTNGHTACHKRKGVVQLSQT